VEHSTDFNDSKFFAPNYWNNVIHRDIPMTKLMNLEITELTSQHIKTFAPLSINKNGHDTGFAGSLYTLGIVTGWSWISAVAKSISSTSIVVAGKADIQYRRPITADFFGQLTMHNHDCVNDWQLQWQTRPSAKQPVTITIGDRNSVAAAQMTATFYIKKS